MPGTPTILYCTYLSFFGIPLDGTDRQRSHHSQAYDRLHLLFMYDLFNYTESMADYIESMIVWHDAWKPEQFIARKRLGKHIPADADAKASNNRRTVFSVVSVALVATQRCCKHIFAAVYQHATIQGAVFSVGPPRGYNNEDLKQLELELSQVPELAVGRIIENKWQERN
jgi:hypothetical protein